MPSPSSIGGKGSKVRGRHQIPLRAPHLEEAAVSWMFYCLVVCTDSLTCWHVLAVDDIFFCYTLFRYKGRLIDSAPVPRELKDSLPMEVGRFTSFNDGGKCASSMCGRSRVEDQSVGGCIEGNSFPSPSSIQHTIVFIIPHPCFPISCLLRPMLGWQEAHPQLRYVKVALCAPFCHCSWLKPWLSLHPLSLTLCLCHLLVLCCLWDAGPGRGEGCWPYIGICDCPPQWGLHPS